MRLRILIVVVCLMIATPIAAQSISSPAELPGQQGSSSVNPIASLVSSIPWESNTAITLPVSQGRFSIPSGYMAIAGNSATKIAEAINGKTEVDVEGIMMASQPSNGYTEYATISYLDIGYVDDSDWHSFDSVKALEKVQRHMTAHGLPPVKWVQSPTYDKDTQTACWIEEERNGKGEDTINSVALRFGRSGVEMFRLIGTADSTDLKGFCARLPFLFSFPSGQTYADHTSDDKSFGFGISDTITTLLGGGLPDRASAQKVHLHTTNIGYYLFLRSVTPALFALALYVIAKIAKLRQSFVAIRKIFIGFLKGQNSVAQRNHFLITARLANLLLLAFLAFLIFKNGLPENFTDILATILLAFCPAISLIALAGDVSKINRDIWPILFFSRLALQEKVKIEQLERLREQRSGEDAG